MPKIELIYFEGCPHTVQARENIRNAAAEVLGHEIEWSEWDLMAASTPDDLKRHGSPTVLIDGRDVTGDDSGNDAMACRADGAPSVAAIAARLS